MDTDLQEIYKDLNPPAIVRPAEPINLERIAQEKSAATSALRNFYYIIIKELFNRLKGTNPLVFNDEDGKTIEVYKNKEGGLVAGVIYGDSENIDYIVDCRKSGTIVIYVKQDIIPTNYQPLKPEYVDSIVPDTDQIHDKKLRNSLEGHMQKLRKKDEGKKATA